MSITKNIIMLTDSYKVSHHVQYPKGTTNVYSYFESRGGDFKHVVFFGLHYLLKQYLERPITQADIDEAATFYAAHFGSDKLFNREGWEYILKTYGGKLPLKIKAVREGTVVPTHNVLMTVEATDDNCYWLTNYVETLLVQVWYPCTVATLSREMKQVILDSLKRTGSPELIPFKLHDFGERGVSSMESAGIGGAAHLVNFRGTDTVPGLLVARDYYKCPMAGFSIPAAEHSTITSWGRENEAQAYANMLVQYPTGLVAVVSDSYDIYNACSNIWGDQLKDKVESRDGCLVVRPDSGIPHEVVLAVLEKLGAKFGTTTNAKGFKVLPNFLRVIQGDGIDLEETKRILETMEKAGWSADNIAFGMGGGLLQKLNRDTQKFAFKCSSVTVDGVERDVYKQPVGDASKHSKRGRLKLTKNEIGGYETLSASVPLAVDILETVYVNGTILVEPNFDEVRKLAELN